MCDVRAMCEVPNSLSGPDWDSGTQFVFPELPRPFLEITFQFPGAKAVTGMNLRILGPRSWFLRPMDFLSGVRQSSAEETMV